MQERTQVSCVNIQPILVCSGKSPICYFCAQQNCTKRAILCGNQHCQCQKLHQDSCSIKAKSKKILDPIYQAKNSPELAEILISVQKVFEDLLELISNQRQKSIQLVENLVFRNGQSDLFAKISNSDYDAITGNLIYKVYSSRKTPIAALQDCINPGSLQYFEKKCAKVISQCSEAIKKQFLLMSKTKHKMTDKISKIVNSKIIETSEQYNCISNFFDKSIISMELLFRASEHKFQSKSFHQFCDGKQNTITVILNEHGKKVGGFNPIKWSSTGGSIKGQKNKFFLFSLTQGEKYECHDLDNAVLYYSSNGPTFGKAQSDIYIPNQPNKIKCNFNIGNSYGKEQLKNVPDKAKRFAGVESGYQAKLKQYEVFQIKFFKDDLSQLFAQVQNKRDK